MSLSSPWHGYALSALGVLGNYIDEVIGLGAALPGNLFVAGNRPVAIAIGRGTQFMYVANQGDNTVAGYVIDPVSGALSPIVGSPFTVGSAPASIAVDFNGKFVYVANSGSSNISAFSINMATGGLIQVAGSPFAMGGNPTQIAVDSTGNYVYAVYNMNTAAPSVSANSVAPGTGALIPVAGSYLYQCRTRLPRDRVRGGSKRRLLISRLYKERAFRRWDRFRRVNQSFNGRTCPYRR